MKNNTIFFLLAFISVGYCINSQVANFQWAQGVGSSALDAGQSVAADASGNVYTTGLFKGTVDFDPGAGTYTLTASAGSEDVFVTKLDASGNFVWAGQLGGIGDDRGLSITIDASGNIYLTGYFNNIADFDPGIGVYNITASSFDDVFVCKLDIAGNFVWAKAFSGNGYEYGQSIDVDLSGNVYTTGYFDLTIDFDPGVGVYTVTAVGNYDAYVSKLDALGNFVWAKVFGGPSNVAASYSIKTDGAGNIFTTGMFGGGIVDFDPGPSINNLVPSGGSADIFVSKLDPAGNFVWVKQMGGTGADYAASITVDAMGNIYTTGHFDNISDFDPGAGTYTLNTTGLMDMFVSKLDASGNFIWARAMGGPSGFDRGYSIAVDLFGNVYTTGQYYYTVDFDPGAPVYNISAVSNSDIFLSKLDASGNFVWAKSMGGTAFEVGHSVFVDASGSVYATGIFNGTCDFDPGAGVYNMTGSGVYDVFILKLCQMPSNPTAIVGNINPCFGNPNTYSIAAVPNAAAYVWTFPAGWAGGSSSNIITGTPGANGNIVVTATNVCGVSASQTLSVSVIPSPTISAVTSTSLLCTGTTATLTANGAVTYTWLATAVGSTAQVTPSVNTTYTVNGTASNGCIGTNSLYLAVMTNSLLTASVTNSIICLGDTAFLIGSSNISYTWSTGANTSSIAISPTVTGVFNYSVNGTDANGCVAPKFLTFTVSLCTVIEQNSSIDGMNLFPNPFSDKLFITLNSIKDSPQIEIYNSLGQLIIARKITEHDTEMDLNDLSNGLYLVSIKSSNNTPLRLRMLKQ